MPRKAKEMSALAVRRLTKDGLHFVGGVTGLALQIRAPSARSWILRTTVNGKRRHIGLGSYPDINLAGARELAREALLAIRGGSDFVAERKAAQARALTFAGAVDKFMIAKHHEKKWRGQLDRYAIPVIGHMPVDQITLRDVHKILEPIWLEKAATASRLRGRIEAVMSWATVAGYRDGENPARWKGNLSELLPRQPKSQRHFPAIPLDVAADWFADLQVREGMGALALQFVALTAARSGEVRGAKWDEIEGDMWIIPAGRMKAGKEHRVPLSQAAQDLLASVPRMAGTDLIFSSARGGMLSDMTLSKVMRTQGFKDRTGRVCVPHGLRSTFRDWAAERTEYPREVSELALAHSVGSEVEQAYRRSDLVEKRRALMTDWSDFLERR
jgi:integrase